MDVFTYYVADKFSEKCIHDICHNWTIYPILRSFILICYIRYFRIRLTAKHIPAVY